MDPKDTEVTAEELEAEKTAAVALKEDEVRANIIAEYGFDEADDAERIDKLTKKEMESHEKLSKAIGQKIGYRTKLAEAGKVVPPKPAAPAKSADAEDVSTVVAKQFEQRDLSEMPYSDDLKKEIQRVATIQGISVKQAARDPYIVSKIKDEEAAAEIEAATIGTKTRGAGGSKKAYTLDTPPDVDMTTPEGRKEWDNWKKWAKEQGN